MTEMLTGACPNCHNGGPHTVLEDPRDPQFQHLVPVTCCNCGLEFIINTATS